MLPAHLVAEHPLLAVEVAVGVGDGILHEGEAALGECAGDDVRLRDHLRGAGELAVVIDGRIALAGLGQHEGVDALGAGELLEIARARSTARPSFSLEKGFSSLSSVA